MNHKKEEIQRFIEKDLIKRAEEAFKEYATTSAGVLEKDLEQLRKEINASFGEGTIDDSGELRKREFAGTPRVKEYLVKREGLNKATGRVDDVYNHIHEFFSRYFDKGDFFSLKRIGGREKYVIPHKGEEVMLHWTNKDQYYIKSGEYFTNYDFMAGSWKVKFALTRVEVEQNNVKGENRYFVLADDCPLEIDGVDKRLTVFFKYRGLTGEEKKEYGRRKKQEAMAERAVESILSRTEDSELGRLLRENVRGDDRTLLERHLDRYVTKNTTDYFIHKDLRGFMDRELEFYLKNEVLHLDNLARMNDGAIRQEMARMRVIREIGGTIIEFLAQIEDFQKMLWEKKKFIIETQYCITVGNIPDDLYEEIASCEAQWHEWKELFHINERQQSLFTAAARNKTEQRVVFLKTHPTLVLDTKHFQRGFKDRLLASFDDLDGMTDGLLIHSENFQAMSLLLEKYRERVKCIYIDPPYNTGNDEFIFKDEYQHSCWIAMMADQLSLLRRFMMREGILFSSIDDNEMTRLTLLLETIFGPTNIISTLPTIMNLKGNQDQFAFAGTHEYTVVAARQKTEARFGEFSLGEEEYAEWEEDEYGFFKRGANLKATGVDAPREKRPNLYFPLYVSSAGTVSVRRTSEQDREILPITNGQEMRWRWSKKKMQKEPHNLIVVEERGSMAVYKKQRPSLGELPSRKPKTLFYRPEYSSGNGTAQIKHLFGYKAFPNPKPRDLIKDFVEIGTDSCSVVLDTLAGSGTTADSAIALNREDAAQRRFILVEMADYFDTVLLPRIKKVTFTPEWKDGKPTRMATTEEAQRSPRIMKYIRLESYEDALNNIVFKAEDKTIQETLDSFRDYFVCYILEYGTRESPTRLAIRDFENPFEYKIKIISDGEEKEQTVDLVETFNYLLGLEVERLRSDNQGDRYYRAVYGKKRDGTKVIIVWRSTKDIDLEADKSFIGDAFQKGQNAGMIYVNGMCHVKGSKPIEPEFKRLMGA